MPPPIPQGPSSSGVAGGQGVVPADGWPGPSERSERAPESGGFRHRGTSCRTLPRPHRGAGTGGLPPAGHDVLSLLTASLRPRLQGGTARPSWSERTPATSTRRYGRERSRPASSNDRGEDRGPSPPEQLGRPPAQGIV